MAAEIAAETYDTGSREFDYQRSEQAKDLGEAALAPVVQLHTERPGMGGVLALKRFRQINEEMGYGDFTITNFHHDEQGVYIINKENNKIYLQD